MRMPRALAALAVTVVLLAAAPAAQAGWEQVGGPVNPNGIGVEPRLANSGGTPVVGWQEQGFPFTNEVKTFSEDQWTGTGNLDRTNSSQGRGIDVTSFNGQLVAAIVDHEAENQPKLYVVRYQAGVWSNLGNVPIASADVIHTPDIEPCGNTLCVAWSQYDPVDDRDEAYVKRLSGSSWISLGDVLNTKPDANAIEPVLADVSGTVGVAWVEDAKVHAAVFNATAWTPIGGNEVMWSPDGKTSDVSVALAANGPHLAWVETIDSPSQDDDPAAEESHVRVSRYDTGTNSWVKVAAGSPVSDPELDAAEVDLATIDGRVHVAYTELDSFRSDPEGPGTYDTTLHVKRLSSGGQSWQELRGTQPIDRDPTYRGPADPDLAQINGLPYLAFQEVTDAERTTRAVYVLRFTNDLDNLAPPTVTGTPALGSTLTCDPGGWTHEPSFQFIWERAPRGTTADDDPAWVAIDGAGDPQYTIQQDDVGTNVRCRVVATDPPNVEEAVSNLKRADAGPPQNTKPPHVTGVPVPGGVMACDPGDWDPSGDFTYQWFRGPHRLIGANGPTQGISITHAFGADFRGDPGFEMTCEVTAKNDVGSTTVRADNSLLAVEGPPVNTVPPKVTVPSPQPNMVNVPMVCDPGKWIDDYSATNRDGHAYEYQWLRAGEVIAGEIDQTYRTKIDDLGKDVQCGATASNPAGRSELAYSEKYPVPLPAITSKGRLLSAQGKNQFVPTNFLAIGREYDDIVKTYSREQLLKAEKAEEARCRAANQFSPALKKPSDQEILNSMPFGPELRCRIIWHNFPSLNIREDGAFLARFFDTPTGRRYLELDMGFGIAPVDPSKPLPIDPLLQARIAAVTPVQVIWDVNDDGRTDATCPGSAPVLRSLLARGDWHPRGIVVYPDSAQTGVFSEARFGNGNVLENPPGISNLPEGKLRDGQPFACRTSLEQPPEPKSQPCITEGKMGRVRVTGNLCPINVRAMDQNEIGYLKTNDPDLYELLDEMAIQQNKDDPNARAALRALAMPDNAPELLPRQFLDGIVPGVPAGDIGATLTNTASSYAGFKPDGKLTPSLEPPKVPAAVTSAVPQLKKDAAQFAMDQMYVARGPLKINGITFTPQVPNPALLVPSDAQEALASLNAMKIAIPDAKKTLGNLVLEANGKLRQEVDDKIQQGKTQLLNASLDKIRDAAKNLKFGPFQWSGDMDIKLEDDGTATMTATASIPFLTGGPGGGGLTTRAKLRGDREGHITLQGFSLKAPSAYLGAMKVKNLLFQYDNGVLVQGKIVFPFPPSNPALDIHKFQLGPDGQFLAMDIEFDAGAGAGIPVGPGVFLNSARAGFDNPLKKFNGGAGIAVGPSATGGCPTVGVKATFDIVFQAVVTFDARGNVELACIPLFNIDVHADTTGYVTVAGGFDFNEGPVFLNAKLGGSVKLPNWQIEFSGSGGVRKVPIIGTLEATLQGVLGDRGLAACGGIKVILVGRVRAGAGVRFVDGRPPFTYAELLKNLRLFTGCDLSSWKSLPAKVRAAQAGGALGFDVPAGKRGMGWSFQGAGDAPRVRLKSPSGKVYDFGDATEGKEVEGAYGVVVDDEDRTVVLIGRPEAGRWTVEPVEGSPPVARIEQADILPPVEVTGRVGGIGSSRVLRYRIPKVPGQVVRLMEEANGASKLLRIVRGGGTGTVRFQTSEAKGTRRRIVAQVVQDELPRDNVTVATFDAPSPKVGRARGVRLRRRGTKVVVSWKRAALALSYDVRADVSDGQKLLLSPKGKATRVTVPRVGKRESVRVRVVGISRAGRRGPAATKRLEAVRKRHAKKRRRARRG